MNKIITGIGLLLQTPKGTFLFQERDKNTKRNPGMITPFGGGIDKGEAPVDCAVRELKEELELGITAKELKEVGIFQSHFDVKTYLQIYLIENVNVGDLTLNEGKSIMELNITDALNHPRVTNFTKEVLKVLETRRLH